MSMYDDTVDVTPEGVSEGAALSGMFGESAPVETERGIETITEEIIFYKNVGGQAVMEGIMMRHKDKYSIAVRRPDQEIELKVEDYKCIFGNNRNSQFFCKFTDSIHERFHILRIFY